MYEQLEGGEIETELLYYILVGVCFMELQSEETARHKPVKAVSYEWEFSLLYERGHSLLLLSLSRFESESRKYQVNNDISGRFAMKKILNP